MIINFRDRYHAELVIKAIRAIGEKYDNVSVMDLNDLVGLRSVHTDSARGWSKLLVVEIKEDKKGYCLEFSEPEPIA